MGKRTQRCQEKGVRVRGVAQEEGSTPSWHCALQAHGLLSPLTVPKSRCSTPAGSPHLSRLSLLSCITKKAGLVSQESQTPSSHTLLPLMPLISLASVFTFKNGDG